MDTKIQIMKFIKILGLESISLYSTRYWQASIESEGKARMLLTKNEMVTNQNGKPTNWL